MKEYIILFWQFWVIVAQLGSLYYTYKGEEHKQIICLLEAIFGCVGPLAFYVLR